MRTVTDLPHETETTENIFIPLRDGHQVAARMWAPGDAGARPVPVLLQVTMSDPLPVRFTPTVPTFIVPVALTIRFPAEP